MGNRAVLTFETRDEAPCIYLHWNGGRDSIRGFMDAAKILGTGQTGSDCERMDALAELLAVHFYHTEVGMTVYREVYSRADTDNYDNGTYILNRDWDIVGRKFVRSAEQNGRDSNAICQSILDSATACACGCSGLRGRRVAA